MNAQETGLRIQQLRKDHGWTQKELAQQLSVTDKSVSKWERGLNYPDMAMLEPLAQVLGTTVVECLALRMQRSRRSWWRSRRSQWRKRIGCVRSFVIGR